MQILAGKGWHHPLMKKKFAFGPYEECKSVLSSVITQVERHFGVQGCAPRPRGYRLPGLNGKTSRKQKVKKITYNKDGTPRKTYTFSGKYIGKFKYKRKVKAA